MPHYPHMLAEDVRVWSAYLRDPLSLISEVWYDVHVGQAVFPGVGAGSLERRVAQGVTRKRIDVVAAVPGGYWVVEVKPRADMTAFGQVVTYTKLFVEDYRAEGKVTGVIVCDSFDEDVLRECDEVGIVVITV